MKKMAEYERDLLYKIGSGVASKARQNAPYVTGNLYEDIQVFDDHIDEGFVEVGNSKNADYAKWVHSGTGIYGEHKTPIVPKYKKALKTPYGFRKSVKGQKANPYLDKALDDYISGGGLDKALKSCSDRICKDIVSDMKKAFKSLMK